MESTQDPGNHSHREPAFEEEIDLRDVLRVPWRCRALILGVFMAAVVTSAVLSFFVLTPVYEVKATISLGYLSPTGANPIHPLYTEPAFAKEVLLSGNLLQEVVEDLQLDISPSQFKSFKEAIQVEPLKDTNLLRLSIETEDPAEGRAVLNKMIEIFRGRSRVQFARQRDLIKGELGRMQADLAEAEQNIKETQAALKRLAPGTGIAADLQQARLLDALSRFEEQRQSLLGKEVARRQELNGIEGMQVIEAPRIPAQPVRPRKMLNIAVAGVLGLMIGVFAAFALEYFRSSPLQE